jgi:hypothetical protein
MPVSLPVSSYDNGGSGGGIDAGHQNSSQYQMPISPGIDFVNLHLQPKTFPENFLLSNFHKPPSKYLHQM